MNNKTEDLNPVQSSQVENSDAPGQAQPDAARKTFVEPEVSFPFDVLEATTFFVDADSFSRLR